jgi:O-acetyl-ADP-ribose deacetylase (regulator of RNase III)
MITYVDDSIFTSPAQTLVNTVNTVGVMGKGIARTFKTIYPDMFADYKSRCETGDFTVGRLLLYRTLHKWVLNFPTKRHWRQPSRLEDIDFGLRSFGQTYAEQGITSVAFPQLGCGQGGLDWEGQVRPLMERHLEPLPIEVTIHTYSGSSNETNSLSQECLTAWLRGEPRVVPYSSVWADLASAVAMGRVASWTHDDGRSSALHLVHPSGTTVIHPDDLFDLWRRLRSFGYLTPDDVTISLNMPAKPVLDLLASLPYVTRARAAPASQSAGYDAHSTSSLLEAPGAQGVRIVSPLLTESRAAPGRDDAEDAVGWNANQTTAQLVLFSTS